MEISIKRRTNGRFESSSTFPTAILDSRLQEIIKEHNNGTLPTHARGYWSIPHEFQIDLGGMDYILVKYP
jgi:hypothetical protein